MKIIKLISAIAIILLFATCNEEITPPTLKVTTDFDKRLVKYENPTFDIKINSDNIITNFAVSLMTKENIIKVFDTTINTNNFELFYTYIVPDSLVCLCSEKQFSLLFQATQEDNIFITKTIDFETDNYNPLFEKHFTAFAVNNDTNNAGYISLTNNMVYTPEEAINYDSVIDFGVVKYLFDLDLSSPSDFYLTFNSVFGTNNWTNRKYLFFTNCSQDSIQSNEFRQIHTDNDIFKYNFGNYSNDTREMNINHFFMFFNKQYKGVVFVEDYDDTLEKKVDIWVKYFINCDSLSPYLYK